MFLCTFFQKIRKKSDEERWQRAFLRFLRPDERLAEQVFVAEARTDFVVLPLEAVAVTVVGTTAIADGEYAARAASGVGEGRDVVHVSGKEGAVRKLAPMDVAHDLTGIAHVVPAFVDFAARTDDVGVEPMHHTALLGCVRKEFDVGACFVEPTVEGKNLFALERAVAERAGVGGVLTDEAGIDVDFLSGVAFAQLAVEEDEVGLVVFVDVDADGDAAVGQAAHGVVDVPEDDLECPLACGFQKASAVVAFLGAVEGDLKRVEARLGEEVEHGVVEEVAVRHDRMSHDGKLRAFGQAAMDLLYCRECRKGFTAIPSQAEALCPFVAVHELDEVFNRGVGHEVRLFVLLEAVGAGEVAPGEGDEYEAECLRIVGLGVEAHLGFVIRGVEFVVADNDFLLPELAHRVAVDSGEVAIH